MIGGRLKIWKFSDGKTVFELFLGLLVESMVEPVMGVKFSGKLSSTILLSNAAQTEQKVLQ